MAMTKVYQPGTTGKRTLFVQPGKVVKGRRWFDPANNPITYSIEFTEGVAEVEDVLADFLVNQGYAKRSALILPSGA